MSEFLITTIGPVEASAIAVATAAIEFSFGYQPRQIASLAVPPGSFDPVRNQFSSVELLKDLAQRAPAATFRILALTEKDLYIPMLTFLFGQAQLGGRVAMVSLARLRQEFYGLPENPQLLASRLAKETLHEVGHTFNLLHCTDTACAMALSTGIKALDAKHAGFCPACRETLKETRTQFEMEKTA